MVLMSDGVPRGPLGTEEAGPTTAIGYCAFCGANARDTTSVRGVYNCSHCSRVWYDHRVGSQQRSFDDYFSIEDGGQALCSVWD